MLLLDGVRDLQLDQSTMLLLLFFLSSYMNNNNTTTFINNSGPTQINPKPPFLLFNKHKNKSFTIY